jgi:hypothetical protein
MANFDDYFEQNLFQHIRILFLSACLLFEVQYVSLQYYGIQQWKARLLRSGSFTIWKKTAEELMANHVKDLESTQKFYSARTSEINNAKQLKKLKALGVEQLAISKH